MTSLDLQPRLDLGDGGAPAGHAQLTNMALALQTLLDCRDAGHTSPRMGLLYGFSGYGKTVAAAFAAARTGAIYIQAQSIWTQLSLLRAIAAELGIARVKRTGPEILEQIVEQLNRTPTDLIVDEMDHLARRGMVEILRDLHDATRSAILMIGEESLPSKLKEWERFDNRILVATPAQPASIADALKLRDHYCNRIRIADDLAALFAERCRGVTRRIVVNLQAAQRVAAENGQSEIDAAWWGSRPISTGEIAVRRREAA